MRQRDLARGKRRLGQSIRRRPSHATVAAYLALIVAVGTGGAYAADKVTSKDIAKNAVRSKHIKKSQVKTADIAKAAVTSEKLACKGNSAQDVMVRAGSVCIDKYENSIWTRKTGGTRITGAIPCNANGQDCDNIFARSVKGVPPRASITWFQAQQALANSGKRLPTNADWQQAVSGTPDSSACNVSTFALASAGASAGCVSRFGAFDMVGNVWEWVADWDEAADGCANLPAGFGTDQTCFGDGTPSRFPGALIRGGNFNLGSNAGPFAVNGLNQPSGLGGTIGFRGAR